MSRRITLPQTVWSQLGPVPVEVVPTLFDEDGKQASGLYLPDRRVIQVEAGMDLKVQVQTVLHEAAHMWLLDAELRLGKREESVVNTVSIGTFNAVFGRWVAQKHSQSA